MQISERSGQWRRKCAQKLAAGYRRKIDGNLLFTLLLQMFVSSAFVITVCRKLSLPLPGENARDKFRIRGVARNKFRNKKITCSGALKSEDTQCGEGEGRWVGIMRLRRKRKARWDKWRWGRKERRNRKPAKTSRGRGNYSTSKVNLRELMTCELLIDAL